MCITHKMQPLFLFSSTTHFRNIFRSVTHLLITLETSSGSHVGLHVKCILLSWQNLLLTRQEMKVQRITEVRSDPFILNSSLTITAFIPRGTHSCCFPQYIIIIITTTTTHVLHLLKELILYNLCFC